MKTFLCKKLLGHPYVLNLTTPHTLHITPHTTHKTPQPNGGPGKLCNFSKFFSRDHAMCECVNVTPHTTPTRGRCGNVEMLAEGIHYETHPNKNKKRKKDI